MIELALILTNIGLVALLFWEREKASKERAEYIDAIVTLKGYSQDLGHIKAVRKNVETQPSFVSVPQPNAPMEELSDEEFDKFVSNEIS